MAKTTITISIKTKRLLDNMRDNKSWDEFLLEIARKARLADKLSVLGEFEKIFTMEDAKRLEEILNEVKLRWRSKE